MDKSICQMWKIERLKPKNVFSYCMHLNMSLSTCLLVLLFSISTQPLCCCHIVFAVLTFPWRMLWIQTCLNPDTGYPQCLCSLAYLSSAIWRIGHTGHGQAWLAEPLRGLESDHHISTAAEIKLPCCAGEVSVSELINAYQGKRIILLTQRKHTQRKRQTHYAELCMSSSQPVSLCWVFYHGIWWNVNFSQVCKQGVCSHFVWHKEVAARKSFSVNEGNSLVLYLHLICFDCFYIA